MFNAELIDKAKNVLKLARSAGLKISAAESCTGGLVSALLTEIPGSSDVFERGYVTYSNDAKIELLTVPTFYIEDFGAVSMETAIAMAEGALLMSKADVSVSVTGIAGPDGGTDDKPVGTVYLATARKDQKTLHRHIILKGSRSRVRVDTIAIALDMLEDRMCD